MTTFLANLFQWTTLKRIFWYAGSQALVTFLAAATGMINSITEPTVGTVIVGLLLAQITKELNK